MGVKKMRQDGDKVKEKDCGCIVRVHEHCSGELTEGVAREDMCEDHKIQHDNKFADYSAYP